jgi:hypothetical protein
LPKTKIVKNERLYRSFLIATTIPTNKARPRRYEANPIVALFTALKSKAVAAKSKRTPPDRNMVSNLLSPRYSLKAKITKNAVHVTNMPWVPPMKRGYEITLLSIEMAIYKREPILFLRRINTNATRFRPITTATFATAMV